MVFSSSFFVFAFLPAILFLVFIGPKCGHKGVLWRNSFLTLGSFVFYAWGEPLWVIPLFVLAWFNYFLGKKIESAKNYEKELASQCPSSKKQVQAKTLLTVGIICNIALLFVVKYGIWVLNMLFNISFYPTFGLHPDPIVLDSFPLPLGVSFFTFQATSYLIDVHRGDITAARRYIDFTCYLTMFSQLIAGPIVRYADIANEINSRVDSVNLFYAGIKRFVVGLAKKVLIANQMAMCADWVFAMPSNTLTLEYAWLGILTYAMQIYFDFSAYSDMAIGIGMMFGFHYRENFQHPYAALSMQDFWRRWHISLSSWLRDYLYIPLGGSHGTKWNTYRNLFIVFFICGLWHGAAFTFIFWGLWHGLFLALERAFLGRHIQSWPNLLRHCYVWCVFLAGWVFFRCEDMAQVKIYFLALSDISYSGVLAIMDLAVANVPLVVMLGVAIFLSFGVVENILQRVRTALQASSSNVKLAVEGSIALWGCFLCVMCGAFILSGSYNPFIYFRF